VIEEFDSGGAITELYAYRALMLSKEYAGLERALGNAMAASGQANLARYDAFLDHVARENAALDEFHAFADAGQARILDEAVTAA
jgi:hypothetical protein